MRRTYQQRIDAVTNYIAQHPQETLSLQRLADLSQFSQFHFHRIFKALTGETVNQFVNRLRLEKAAGALIYTPRRSITAIALDLGYSSSANFSKAFKQHYNCSPSQFRRNKKRIPNEDKNSKNGKDLSNKNIDTVPAWLESMSISIKELPPQRLAYLRADGRYQAQTIAAMFKDLHQWLEDNQVAKQGPDIVINWSDTYVSADNTWRYDVCAQVSGDCVAKEPFQVETLDGGTTAVFELSMLPQHFSPKLQQCWDYILGSWLPDSGYLPAHRPSYERFGDINPAGLQQVSLCLPIEKESY